MIFDRVSRQLCLNEGIAVQKINEGHCFEWARRVALLCPAAEIFYVRRLVPHAFIYFSGHWYDAQRPLGASHWLKLPLLKACKDLLGESDLIRWQPGDRFWRPLR